MDAVLSEAANLRRSVSARDQHKLDEYLESARDVELRIEQAGKKGELQGWRPRLEQPNVPRPADGIPQNIADHMRLMCDILVLGFQTDTTRIAILKLNKDQLPVVLLGRGGGRVETGRVLNYRDKPNRQLCRLYLSIMDKMGVRPKTFGDATEPLDEV